MSKTWLASFARKNNFFWASLFCLGLLAACSTDDPVVASFRGHKLLRSELRKHMPPPQNPADSQRTAKLYIEQWLKEEAMLARAQDSLTDLEQRIRYKVEDYERKMAAAELMQHMVNSRLDTQITAQEFILFFQAHRADYVAQQPMYQYLHMRVARARATNELATQMGQLPSLPALMQWAQTNAEAYKLDTTWVDGGTLAKLQERCPQNLRALQPRSPVLSYTETGQPLGPIHYFCMLNTVAVGQAMPLSLVSYRIRNQILNERRYKLIEAYEKQILQEAYANQDIKVF